MANRFRGHYGQLNGIANTFISQGAEISVALHNLRARQEQLEHGDWQGEAAEKFYAEMNNAVRPALQKLANALGEAAIISKKIAKITKDAEDSSSRIFVIVVNG